jgi:hypothetical protein
MSGKNADLVNVAVLTTMGLKLSERWAFAYGMKFFGVNTPYGLTQKGYGVDS